jgi:hypothetical protein
MTTQRNQDYRAWFKIFGEYFFSLPRIFFHPYQPFLTMIKYSRKTIWIFQLIVFFICSETDAQKFWRVTNEFPGGPKTSIALAGDSCLFAGLINGILRSCNEGDRFDVNLHSSTIFTLYSTRAGTVLAGGTGKIFRTADLGQTWDSVSLHSIYPVVQIIENLQGELFGITGGLDQDFRLNGDGMFYSNDSGATWVQRNQGLGDFKSCERIAADKNGRLYLGVADENVTGQGGLFISENKGLLWEHIDITVDGRGAVSDQIKISNTFGLSVSPEDSVYLSYSGIAVNNLVQFNMVKHIQDVRKTSFWMPYLAGNSSTWWLDRIINNIHFARNGDRYSSAIGTINTGGTFFSKARGSGWKKIDYGLGLDVFGERNVQFFTEARNGKIFMVQFLDERVYWADTSLVTSIRADAEKSFLLHLYPNPVLRSAKVTLQTTFPFIEHHLSIIDFNGRTVRVKKLAGSVLEFEAPQHPGWYYLQVENKFSIFLKPFMVW